jgi:hypothetical protein
MTTNAGTVDDPTVSERNRRGAAQLRRLDGDAELRVVESLATEFPDVAAYLLEFPTPDS